MYTMSCPKLSDPTNPTQDDLRIWAYTPNAMYPDEMSQDWEFCITNFENASLLLQFASDPACPNRKFFVRCLYILSGECIRTPGGCAGIPHLQEFLRSVTSNAPPDILLWVQRTEHLLAHPETYDYDCWGSGYFANDEFIENL
jgi:hypothetical protein